MSSANSKIHEPSMEEILASIRRIIADDQEVLRGAGRDRAEPSSLANVLDLTERQAAQMLVQPRAGQEPKSAGGAVDREILRKPYEFEQNPDDDLHLVTYDDEADDLPDAGSGRDTRAESFFSDPPRADTLLSGAADACVADAFSRLGSVLMPTQPQTLEDLMKDLLRPMLKAWLDENLPTLVERLVQAEIDRISRRR